MDHLTNHISISSSSRGRGMLERSRDNRLEPYPPRGTKRMVRVPYSTTRSGASAYDHSSTVSSTSSQDSSSWDNLEDIVLTDDDSSDSDDGLQQALWHDVSVRNDSSSQRPRTPPRQHDMQEAQNHTTLTPATNRIQISSRSNSQAEPPPPLAYKIIAHDSKVQEEMDRQHLPWGVQYEIARGVSDRRWKWEDVTRDKISTLRTDTNVKAAQVPAVILGRPLAAASAPVNEQRMWKELDREQMALEEGEQRGLGLHGLDEGEAENWDGIKRWYGGKIQQSVQVEMVDKQPQLRLAPMEMRKSNRFARFLGSRRMLSLNLPKNWDGGESFMRHKFVLCGRVFIPFCVKDNGAYLMEINEDYERRPDEGADGRRRSLQEFIEWHNPLALNGKQAVSKWVARFDLGLSTSVPALRLKPGNIFLEDDIVINGKMFTDGCGYMNLAGLMQIAQTLGYEHLHCGIQGRVLGSKGLWVLHPSDRDPSAEPKIWIRHSQVKVKLASDWSTAQLSRLHPAHLIFDLVQPSRVSAPSRLSKYPIMNLSHNKVPTELISELMETSLRELVHPFTQWERQHAMLILWCTIYRAGNVTTRRLQRHAAGLARALGISRQFREYGPNGELITDDSESEDEEEDEKNTEANADPRLFTAPDSLHESVLELIQAGFNPSTLSFLLKKVKTVVQQILDAYLNDYHIVVPESAEALIIPDPYGVLEEGQIHFRSSQPLMDSLTNLDPHQLFGKVLLFRNPCRLPSDIQPAVAISHPRLAEYKDVIVLPTKGSHPLADRLAGGDYDGDTAVCIFNQPIVNAYRLPEFNAVPADFIASNFESQTRTLQVSQFAEEIKKATGREVEVIQDRLLSGFINNKVGKYSIYHDNAAYAYGLGSDITVRLGHMFNHVLDSRKSGLIVQTNVFKGDMDKFARTPPPCMSKKGFTGGNIRYLPRRRELGPFILDQLHAKIESVSRDVENQLKLQINGDSIPQDPDLLRPWADAKKTGVAAIERELDLIEAHVKSCRTRWELTGGGSSSSFNTESQAQRKKKDKQKLVQDIQEKFRQKPDGVVLLPLMGPGTVDILKASFAYSIRGGDTFAFSMAFKLLCRIKAESQGMVAITREFSESMSIPSSIARLLTMEQENSG